jgi:hypothetical protein
MKVILNVDRKLFDNEIKARFQDFWDRVVEDLKTFQGSKEFVTLSGNFEIETATMLQTAFEEAIYGE